MDLTTTSEDLLAALRPKVAAAGWDPRAVEEGREILRCVLNPAVLERAPLAIRSKAEILIGWSYLEYWYFDGAPLSTQVALFVGLESGALRPPREGEERMADFRSFFLRQLAFEAAKRQSEVVGGWLFPNEAELFWDCLASISDVPGDVMEIGSWVGRSTILLAAGCEALAPGRRLHVVDDWQFGNQPTLYPYLTARRELRAEFDENLAAWNDLLVVHEGTFQAAAPMLTQIHGGFSLVFHDAGHTADDFQRDLPLIYSLLNPGGVLLVHDYVSKNFAEAQAVIDSWIEKHHDLSLAATVATTAVIKRNVQ